MYILRKLLNKEEVKHVTDYLAKTDDWKQGHTNASKEHKNNLELTVEPFAKLIAQKIRQHPIATSKLFIKRMTLPRFNCYKEDNHYSRHVDCFKQEGVQTDWSYTLMLTAPEKGGNLRIETEGKIDEVSLDIGDIVIYPSGKIHEVTPVTKGERIAAIGWIESLITSQDKRSIVSSMVDVMQDLDNKEGEKENVLRLSHSYHNLLRLWSK